jgi:hypothetical protein
MGEQKISQELGAEDLRRFMQRLLVDLRALERMLDEGMIERDVRRIGAEQEMFLVGPDLRAANRAMEALDGLGDTLVFCGQLCITARLALGPILALAVVWHRDPGAVPGKWQPVSAAGYLAHVTGKRQQRTRGFADDAHSRRELVRALALVSVRAVDNVTVNQMISGGWDAVNPVAVYFVTGQHVIARSDADPTVTTAGVDGVESPVAEVIEERFLDGTEQEVSDAEIVTDIDELRARIIEVAADFGLRQATPEEVSEWLRPAVTGGVADQRAASASDTPTIEITAEEIEEALRAEPEAP